MLLESIFASHGKKKKKRMFIAQDKKFNKHLFNKNFLSYVYSIGQEIQQSELISFKFSE